MQLHPVVIPAEHNLEVGQKHFEPQNCQLNHQPFQLNVEKLAAWHIQVRGALPGRVDVSLINTRDMEQNYTWNN